MRRSALSYSKHSRSPDRIPRSVFHWRIKKDLRGSGYFIGLRMLADAYAGPATSSSTIPIRTKERSIDATGGSGSDAVAIVKRAGVSALLASDLFHRLGARPQCRQRCARSSRSTLTTKHAGGFEEWRASVRH
jgi:hypothetical protein